MTLILWRKKQRSLIHSPYQPDNFSLFLESIQNKQLQKHHRAKYMMKQTSLLVVLHQIHSKQSDLRLVERHLLECWTHELKRVGTSCPISSQIFNKIFHQIFLWAKTKCSQIFSGISQISVNYFVLDKSYILLLGYVQFSAKSVEKIDNFEDIDSDDDENEVFCCGVCLESRDAAVPKTSC